jgi:hypothetical protein
MSSSSPFVVDETCSDHEYLFVDIHPLATVVIKLEAEGIVVDIYPLGCSGEPLATTCALGAELCDDGSDDALRDAIGSTSADTAESSTVSKLICFNTNKEGERS